MIIIMVHIWNLCMRQRKSGKELETSFKKWSATCPPTCYTGDCCSKLPASLLLNFDKFIRPNLLDLFIRPIYKGLHQATLSLFLKLNELTSIQSLGDSSILTLDASKALPSHCKVCRLLEVLLKVQMIHNLKNVIPPFERPCLIRKRERKLQGPNCTAPTHLLFHSPHKKFACPFAINSKFFIFQI